MTHRITFALLTTTAALAALQLAATGCGPGDGCEVTATCPQETGGGGAGASGGSSGPGGPGGAGGTGTGQGGTGGSLAPNGTSCDAGSECASGNCVDTVCCESACDGACVSCNILDSEGTCSPYLPGADPEAECGGGVCDGSGECAVGGHIWSQRFGDSSDQFGNGLAVAPDGRSALVGVFTGNPNFGQGALPYQGSGDAFVAMFEPNGDLAWANAYGASDNQDNAQAAAFDPSGNLVVTGWYNSTGLTFGGSTLPSVSSIEIFLVKLNATGGHLWSKGFTGAYNQIATDVAVAPDGAITIVGEYGSISAAPGSAPFDFGTGTLSHGGEKDAFVARFDENGTPTWAIGFGDDSSQMARRVAVASDGDIAVVGDWEGTAAIGGETLSGDGDYVAVLDQNGNVSWTFLVNWTSTDSAQFNDVSFAPDGSVLVVGSIKGTVDLGGGPVSATGLNLNAFVARYDATGALLSVQTFADSNVNRDADTLEVDSSGNVVLYGKLQGDAILAKLAPSLDLLWLQTFTHVGNEMTLGIDASGASVLGGTFTGTTNFGGMTLPSAGGSDVFMARFAP